MEIIALKNLSFTYPNEQKKALDGISLSISSGEFVTVCGKSGCGKSTLLKMLKPSLTPNGKRNGEIILFSKPFEEIDERFQSEKTGFVFQDPDNQIACDKVWHELAFGLESLGAPASEIRNKTAEIASYFGINTWFEKKTSELSGGQKQLLSLASVMVMNPEVIILDEPTSRLDPIAAQRFLNTLSELNKDFGITVILSEHRLENAFALSDRAVVMDSGRIIYDGAPNGICTDRIIHSQMLCAMPTAVRVAASFSHGESCPVTVKEGREYLSEMLDKKVEYVPAISEKACGKTAIELKEVCFRYEKKSDDIIKNLSFKVYEGEFFALVGANGAGKTTALSLISGILKPNSGKIKINGKEMKDTQDSGISLMPQNPQSLFVKSTVLEDLKYAAEKSGSVGLIDEITSVCGLGKLLMRHPYDLSGGEQQRAALALVLLSRPKIILLDESTKGIDAHFKIKLSKIIKRLNTDGITVVAVSHDIEFCAEFADRCAMLFNGEVISCDAPRSFFKGNTYYTTSAAVMAKGFIDNVLLTEDIIKALGGTVPKVCEDLSDGDTSGFAESQKTESRGLHDDETESKQISKTKSSFFKISIGVCLFLLSVASVFLFKGKFAGYGDIAYQLATVAAAACGLRLIIPKKNNESIIKTEKKGRGGIRLYSIGLIAAAVTAIGFTVYFGSVYLHNKKYYFISLLIILEAMAAFFLSFEKKKPRIAEVVVISALCAFGVAGRAAFAATPQFKPVAALVIVSGMCLGGETGFLIGAVTAFVSNFIFGQGVWTPWQMFGFGAIGLIAGTASRFNIIPYSKKAVTVFGFLLVLLIYGPLLNLSYLMTGTEETSLKLFFYYCLLGLPFDLIHAVSTAFFLWFGAGEMTEKLKRIKLKYGIFE